MPYTIIRTFGFTGLLEKVALYTPTSHLLWNFPTVEDAVKFCTAQGFPFTIEDDEL